MKKLLLITTCAVIMATSVMAAEPEADVKGLYISPKFVFAHEKLKSPKYDIGGITGQESDGSDSVAGGALAIGYDFNSKFKVPVRAELEYAMRGDAKKNWTSVGVDTLMINGFYDFRNSSDFTPYVGAGIGMAFVDLEVKEAGLAVSDTKTNFAWNIGAGLNYEINQNVAVGVGYRYFDYGKAEISKNIGSVPVKAEGDTTAHEILLALRYTF